MNKGLVLGITTIEDLLLNNRITETNISDTSQNIDLHIPEYQYYPQDNATGKDGGYIDAALTKRCDKERHKAYNSDYSKNKRGNNR